jgi:hypothetical protein
MSDLPGLFGPLVIGSVVVSAVVVLVVLFVVFKVVGGLAKGSRETQQLLATGTPASARILQIQHTGTTVSYGGARQLQVMIWAEVNPPGGAPYQAQFTSFVSELQIPQIQPGSEVRVRFDSANPSRVALEGVGASPVTGQPIPARTGMPAGAKIGLAIGCLGAAVGLGVAGYVVAVNVMGVGLDRPSNTTCGRAAACCEAITRATGNTASAANCKNVKKVGVPDAVCREMLDTFRRTARQLKVTCE